MISQLLASGHVQMRSVEASLRLDAVASAGLRVSRAKAADLAKRGDLRCAAQHDAGGLGFKAPGCRPGHSAASCGTQCIRPRFKPTGTHSQTGALRCRPGKWPAGQGKVQSSCAAKQVEPTHF